MQSVCIGVHVHAGPERLHATLESLRAHAGRAFDLLLLPDGPDNVTKTALSRLDHLPQLGTVEPLGPPSCFNRLVTSSSADVLVLLESGALVGPRWLDYLLAALADPANGLAGPSTNRSWNEQCVFPRAGGTLAEVARMASHATQRFGTTVRTLEPLYSLGDFCYVVRRAVVAAIGVADEDYGLGPCWEMDYNIRAARAGFRGVWACGAYVYRAPFTARRQREESLRFENSKHLYQDKFCGLRLRGEKTSYEPHCRGEACEHFAPRDLIQITLQPGSRGVPLQEASVEQGTNSNLPGALEVIAPVAQARPSSDSQPAPVVSLTNDLPLVSCIMPTRNRRAFVRQALVYFERQDYPNRELIIVDDGDDRVSDLVPPDAPVRYITLSEPTSIGTKRNIACEQARGAIIAHWDDDDWYAPHRLRHQVAPLLDKKADITGLETSCFFDLAKWQTWTCTPQLHRHLFVGDVHGGTLVYWRYVWERMARYPAASVAEDALFLRQACRQGAKLHKLPHANSFVYVRHNNNAWKFPLGSYLMPAGWKRADLSAFLPAEDFPFYTALSPAAPQDQRQQAEQGQAVVPILDATSEPMPACHSKGDDLPSSCTVSPPSPLVSCIMPTYNRRMYVPQAIQYFLRQDYPNRELLILDDGTEPVGDLVPTDPRIRYVRLDKRAILGAKRNLACEMARGTIIAHWDDDDWMAPHRLSYQLEILEQKKADLCGAGQQLYFDPSANRAWLYAYPPTIRSWLAGNTLCYRKTFWANNPFPKIAISEDTRFVWSPRATNAVVVPDYSFYVGMVHPHNTSKKIVTGRYWHPHPVERIYSLLGADLAFYRSTCGATK